MFLSSIPPLFPKKTTKGLAALWTPGKGSLFWEFGYYNLRAWDWCQSRLNSVTCLDCAIICLNLFFRNCVNFGLLCLKQNKKYSFNTYVYLLLVLNVGRKKSPIHYFFFTMTKYVPFLWYVYLMKTYIQLEKDNISTFYEFRFTKDELIFLGKVTILPNLLEEEKLSL